MTDQVPPHVTYTNEQLAAFRLEVNDRFDKQGGEIADERKARELGDKDLADDITAMSTRRAATWSARVWALAITGVTLLGGGVVTLIVYLVEAASHLPTGTP